MKLHTDLLTERSVHAATANLPGVYADVSTHGSRDYARALSIKLEGNGRRGNSGSYGPMDDGTLAATYDEWGAVMAALLDQDPNARFGDKSSPTYDGREHFRWVTGNRYDHGLPRDAHKAHRWEIARKAATGVYYVSHCKGSKGHPCGAILRRPAYGYTWADIVHA